MILLLFGVSDRLEACRSSGDISSTSPAVHSQTTSIYLIKSHTYNSYINRFNKYCDVIFTKRYAYAQKNYSLNQKILLCPRSSGKRRQGHGTILWLDFHPPFFINIFYGFLPHNPEISFHRGHSKSDFLFITKFRGGASMTEKGQPTYDELMTRLEQAEASLRESEQNREYLDFALQGSGIGTWEWNTKTNETRFNEQWAGILGYTLEELSPVEFATWERLTHPDDAQSAFKAIAEYQEGITTEYECEFRMKHKQGDWRWILAQARFLKRDEEGNVLTMFGTHVDITERKLMEDALRESEEMLSETTKIARIGGWKVDVTGNTLLWTDEVFRIYELPPGDPLSVEDSILFYHEEDRDMVSEAVQQSIEQGIGFDFEARIITAKQNLVWVRAVGSTTFEDGKPFYLWGTIQDITPTKHAEAERERLTMAIEQAAEGVVITDAEGIMQYVNPAFEKITGYGKEEALGQNPRILKSGKQSEAFYSEMWATLKRGDTWTGRFMNQKKDGSLYNEEDVISPVRDGKGRTINYVAVKRDITEELSTQAQLHQSQKMEAIGRLAGGIAHDFNNMLGVILGNCEIALMSMEESQPFAEYFERIQGAAERSENLTRQLLGFARKQTMIPKKIDLNQVISSMYNMLPRLIGEEIEIQWTPGKALSPLFMDPVQIDQILMNLCLNARDAIEGHGKVIIETENIVWDEACCNRVEERTPGEYVRISVKDDGQGMDAKTQEKVFEPFYSTKEVGKGTGLGLSTVYGIVKQNHGYVHVDSVPGQGSAFEIYLPAYTAYKNSVDSPHSQKKNDQSPKGTETVLLVEDEPEILEVASMMLKHMGYHVFAESSAKDALNKASSMEEEIHLLITDLVMPEMNGRKLARGIREQYPESKCLFMSGYDRDIIAHHGVLEDQEHFIHKPFSFDDFAVKIREVLSF